MPSSKNQEPVKLSQSQLDSIITLHNKFLEGDTGGARCVLKFKDLSGLTMRGKNLTGADFTGSLLCGVDMSEGIFETTSFFVCDLRHANLEFGKFSRADFRGAYVLGANLTGADLNRADLREGVVMEGSGAKSWGRTQKNDEYTAPKATKTIFSGAKLAQTNLSKTRARNVDFSDADLTGVIIQDSDMRESRFENANLTDVDFTGSDLRESSMKGAIMIGTIMISVEKQGCDFTDTVTQETINKTLNSLEEPLEDLIKQHEQWIATAGKKGKQLDLNGYDMRNVKSLKGHALTAMTARGANFVNLDLRKTHMQFCILDRADFRDASLGGSDMRGASFKKTNLSRADLEGADLSALGIPGPDKKMRLLRGNLSGVNFRHANLRNVNLRDSILRGADLSHAVLNGCDLRGADLEDAIIDGANIKDAFTDPNLNTAPEDSKQEEQQDSKKPDSEAAAKEKT